MYVSCTYPSKLAFVSKWEYLKNTGFNKVFAKAGHHFYRPLDTEPIRGILGVQKVRKTPEGNTKMWYIVVAVIIFMLIFPKYDAGTAPRPPEEDIYDENGLLK